MALANDITVVKLSSWQVYGISSPTIYHSFVDLYYLNALILLFFPSTSLYYYYYFSFFKHRISFLFDQTVWQVPLYETDLRIFKRKKRSKSFSTSLQQKINYTLTILSFSCLQVMLPQPSGSGSGSG